MTWTASLCALLVMAAALLAADVADADRAHRPFAALLAVWMVDPLRPVDGSALADAWSLALPALSALVAGLVWGRSLLTAAACAGVVLLNATDELTASIVSIAAQLLAVGGVAGRPLTLADRACFVLLAGDVAALGGPLGDRGAWAFKVERWWIVQWQGALVAAVLVALHLHARRARV